MAVDPSVYEKLGQFYLGRPYDLDAGEITDGVTLYDARDLTTHAVCVGMTGSGKTGLCVTLLEEAALDGIPALVVDPKGDLTNLLLTFPDLRPSDFRPWVDPDEARRQDLTTEAFAARQADLWKTGLARWGQDGDRIARLRAAAEFLVLTPGSTAGTPVSILGSFAAPPAGVGDDPELMADRIESLVTSLLALLGVDADPLKSREHILVSRVIQDAWSRGEDLDLEGLIHHIQRPGMDRVGVMDLESFYPAADRFELATALNNLLAAPGFQAWLQGVPLDAGRLLRSPEGHPRVAVLSIAHLSDAERMFFVSLLLNETLGWMRTQSGTSSLRALLYIDEIFGFMPPVAEPPSKKPLLTLLKQARAFGLGVVLATQNPVDLDYKGLSNAGTWFVGRLQTERDRARLLAGLEGAAATEGGAFDREELGRILARVGQRVFLLHNVHDDEPRLFHTRWAMSYLRGPLTRDQIRRLANTHTPQEEGMEEGVAATLPTGARPEERGSPSGAPGASVETRVAEGSDVPPPSAETAATPVQGRPLLPPDVPEAFVRPRTEVVGSTVRYVPAVLGLATIHYRDPGRGVDHKERLTLVVLLSPGAGDISWDEARPFGVDEDQLDTEPMADAVFGPLPPSATDGRRYTVWERDLVDHLYRNRPLTLFRSEALGAVSKPGESEAAFRVRLSQALRERRDDEMEALRQKFEARIRRAREAVGRAESALDTQEDQARRANLDAAISVGESLLSAFVGRRRRGSLRRAGTAARRVGKRDKEARDVDRAEEVLRGRKATLVELEGQLKEELDGIRNRLDPTHPVLGSVSVQPRRRDVEVRRVTLAWVPVRRGPAPPEREE